MLHALSKDTQAPQELAGCPVIKAKQHTCCRGAALVILNGTILGIHRQPVRFAAAFRQLRRCNRIGEFVSVYIQQECCYIASDGGRCSPLILCTNPFVLAWAIEPTGVLLQCRQRCCKVELIAYMHQTHHTGMGHFVVAHSVIGNMSDCCMLKLMWFHSLTCCRCLLSTACSFQWSTFIGSVHPIA